MSRPDNDEPMPPEVAAAPEGERRFAARKSRKKPGPKPAADLEPIVRIAALYRASKSPAFVTLVETMHDPAEAERVAEVATLSATLSDEQRILALAFISALDAADAGTTAP